MAETTKTSEYDKGLSIKTGENNFDQAMGAAPAPISKGYTLVKDVKGAFESKDAGDIALAAGTVITDTTGFIQSIGSTAQEIATDPIGWLVGQGLSFLVSIFQPLEDAIELVSGDPEGLSQGAGNFKAIGESMVRMSQDLVRNADETLQEWTGDASEVAKKRLGEFASGIEGVAAKSGNVSEILQLSSMLMTIVKQVIMAIITELVTWLITIWIPALAAAVPTAGASTAAASTASAAKGASSVSKGNKIVQMLRRLLDKIKEFWAKLKDSLAKVKADGFLKSIKDNKAALDRVGKIGLEKGAGYGETLGKSVLTGLKEAGMKGLKEIPKATVGINPGNFGDGSGDGVKPGATVNDLFAKGISHAKSGKKASDAGAIGDEQSHEETSDKLDI
ncbi:WXG100 family type VII secretion target [Amycolatopsis lurida]